MCNSIFYHLERNDSLSKAMFASSKPLIYYSRCIFQEVGSSHPNDSMSKDAEEPNCVKSRQPLRWKLDLIPSGCNRGSFSFLLIQAHLIALSCRVFSIVW